MMKNTIFILLLSLLSLNLFPAPQSRLEVYMLTCSPGTESYSIYGHSALRVVNPETGSDLVYNWGVFDFSTPNFNYKFARGRLNYMLGIYPYNRFLQEYFQEGRSVWSQRVNFDARETDLLMELLNENAKPENVYYRYDFFMDNCATRIRDLFEKVGGKSLVYPDYQGQKSPTYRERLQELQSGYPWLDMGIDLLLGTPGDNDCDYRGSMFLPEYLKDNLALAKLSDEEGEHPLLGEVVTVLEFDHPSLKLPFYSQAWFFLSIVFLLVFIFTFSVKSKILQTGFDLLFFLFMSLLAFLMIFTNYLTEHIAMGNNFNMVWLNPMMPIALYAVFRRESLLWFWRTQIALSLFFMLLIAIIRQSLNPAFIPVILILVSRSYYRLTTSFR